MDTSADTVIAHTPTITSTTAMSVWRRKSMPKCGVCGWTFSDRTLMKHAETPCGEENEKAGKYLPEVDDLIKQLEEEQANG